MKTKEIDRLVKFYASSSNQVLLNIKNSGTKYSPEAIQAARLILEERKQGGDDDTSCSNNDNSDEFSIVKEKSIEKMAYLLAFLLMILGAIKLFLFKSIEIGLISFGLGLGIFFLISFMESQGGTCSACGHFTYSPGKTCPKCGAYWHGTDYRYY